MVASQPLPASAPGPAFSHHEYCARIRRETGLLANLIGGSDLAVKVPWSRTWRLGDLVHHVGSVHRWAASIVEAGARRYLRIRDTDDWPTEPGSAEAARWLRAGGDRLLSVLEVADPERKVWAWGVDQHVRFWPRRMTHETGIHRADAELALGLAPRFDQAAASDGMSEFLGNLWRARAWRRGMGALRGEGERIGFTATDTGEGWLVTRHPRGFDWSYQTRGPAPHAEVTVEGPVRCLYLLAWKRIPLDAPEVTTSGDQDVLRHWYRHSSV